jgi:hypothetical protein
MYVCMSYKFQLLSAFETEYNKTVTASFIGSDWQSLATSIYLRVD